SCGELVSTFAAFVQQPTFDSVSLGGIAARTNRTIRPAQRFQKGHALFAGVVLLGKIDKADRFGIRIWSGHRPAFRCGVLTERPKRAYNALPRPSLLALRSRLGLGTFGLQPKRSVVSIKRGCWSQGFGSPLDRLWTLSQSRR